MDIKYILSLRKVKEAIHKCAVHELIHKRPLVSFSVQVHTETEGCAHGQSQWVEVFEVHTRTHRSMVV